MTTFLEYLGCSANTNRNLILLGMKLSANLWPDFDILALPCFKMTATALPFNADMALEYLQC